MNSALIETPINLIMNIEVRLVLKVYSKDSIRWHKEGTEVTSTKDQAFSMTLLVSCHVKVMNVCNFFTLCQMTLRSSICPWKSYFDCERDLRHTGVVTSSGHWRPRWHHIQPPLQEVHRWRQEVHTVRRQRPLYPQAVWSLVNRCVSHRPATGL